MEGLYKLIIDINCEDSRRNNARVHQFFLKSNETIVDDYFVEISDLLRSPENSYLVLKLLFGVQALGSKMKELYFKELVSYSHHPFYGQLNQEFVRVAGIVWIINRYIIELKKMHTSSYYYSILHSSAITRPNFVKKKVAVGDYEIIEMVLYNKWTGSIYNIGKVLTKNDLVKLNLVYNNAMTEYFLTLCYIFLNQDFVDNFGKNKPILLQKIISVLPKPFQNYTDRFNNVLPLVINKAIALNLIDNDDFTYE